MPDRNSPLGQLSCPHATYLVVNRPEIAPSARIITLAQPRIGSPDFRGFSHTRRSRVSVACQLVAGCYISSEISGADAERLDYIMRPEFNPRSTTFEYRSNLDTATCRDWLTCRSPVRLNLANITGWPWRSNPVAHLKALPSSPI